MNTNPQLNLNSGCICERKPAKIVCENQYCTFMSTQGRMRKYCSFHPKVTFLMDLVNCPKCGSSCQELDENDQPYGAVQQQNQPNLPKVEQQNIINNDKPNGSVQNQIQPKLQKLERKNDIQNNNPYGHLQQLDQPKVSGLERHKNSIRNYKPHGYIKQQNQPRLQQLNQPNISGLEQQKNSIRNHNPHGHIEQLNQPKISGLEQQKITILENRLKFRSMIKKANEDAKKSQLLGGPLSSGCAAAPPPGYYDRYNYY